MAWERRGESLYYYRSVREGEKVRKEYVGRGEIAEALAHADETIRRSRAERIRREDEELERVRLLVSCADELHETAEALARAEMVAAGYHRHKGEWRRRKNA
jgi:hypothetical protein